MDRLFLSGLGWIPASFKSNLKFELEYLEALISLLRGKLIRLIGCINCGSIVKPVTDPILMDGD